MSTLCKGSDKRLAHDADKVAQHLKDGKPVYQCLKCRRLSHKKDHLCSPQEVRVAAVEPQEPIAAEIDDGDESDPE